MTTIWDIPYPIYDLKAWVQKPYPIYDQNGRKTMIPFVAARTYIAHIREYRPPPLPLPPPPDFAQLVWSSGGKFSYKEFQVQEFCPWAKISRLPAKNANVEEVAETLRKWHLNKTYSTDYIAVNT